MKTCVRLNLLRIGCTPCSRLATQYLIELIVYVTVNNYLNI